jgi:hypothetical protein
LLFSGLAEAATRGGGLAGFLDSERDPLALNIAFVKNMYYPSQVTDLQVKTALNCVFDKVIQFKSSPIYPE